LIEYSRTKAKKAQKIEKCPKNSALATRHHSTNNGFCNCLPKFTVLIKKYGKLQATYLPRPCLLFLADTTFLSNNSQLISKS
jgi:hypothetical protein